MKIGRKKKEAAPVAPPKALGKEKPLVLIDDGGKPRPGQPGTGPLAPGQERLSHVRMDDLPKREFEERKLTPPRRGPATGVSAKMTDLDFLAANATEDEIRTFRAIAQSRVARTTMVWVRCDDPKCGFVHETRSTNVGSACVRCNLGGGTAGGHLRVLTAAEVKQYVEWKAAEDKRAEDRMRTVAFNRNNAERQKLGDGPLTMAEFLAEQKRHFGEMLKTQAMFDQLHYKKSAGWCEPDDKLKAHIAAKRKEDLIRFPELAGRKG